MESSAGNTMQCFGSLDCYSLALCRPNNLDSLHAHPPAGEQGLLETESHSLLNSFSLKHLPPSFPPYSNPFASHHLADPFDADRIDISLPYLALSRGTSENYEYFEEESSLIRMPYSVNQPPSLPHNASHSQHLRQADEPAGRPSSLFLPISEQELKSGSKDNDFCCGSSVEEEAGPWGSRVGLKVTKNVTKNIGKLLFKFIWKHRRTLGQRLEIEKSQWESFTKVISLWKKQNNITRQYLMRRWHGEEQHCALFRRLSRHFFRMRCLPAIMKSHIRLKKVHYERIYRFSAAITDPTALASLA